MTTRQPSGHRYSSRTRTLRRFRFAEPAGVSTGLRRGCEGSATQQTKRPRRRHNRGQGHGTGPYLHIASGGLRQWVVVVRTSWMVRSTRNGHCGGQVSRSAAKGSLPSWLVEGSFTWPGLNSCKDRPKPRWFECHPTPPHRQAGDSLGHRPCVRAPTRQGPPTRPLGR